MKPLRLRALGMLLASSLAVPAFGNVIWTGDSISSSHWSNPDNWVDGVTPANSATDLVIFGDARRSYVSSFSTIYANGLSFSGITRAYFIDGSYDGSLIDLHLGSGGITYSPATPVKSTINTDLELESSQTWNIASGTLTLQGHIYDGDSGYTFTKTGAGTLVLGDTNNEFDTSTVVHTDGRLVLTASYPYYNDHPLGAANLIIGPATGGNNPILVAAGNQGMSGTNNVTLNNAVTLNGALTTENQTEFHFTGPVSLNLDTTINSTGKPLFIEGDISESGGAHSLTVNGTGAVVLTGSNSYTGGTAVTTGGLIFGNDLSIPNNQSLYAGGALTVGANGYMGIAFVPTGDYSNATDTLFLAHFDRSKSSGTIGFDSDPQGTTNTFTDPVDLTGFGASARIGSATSAILGWSAVITPQGTDYRFGGGGGGLQVDSLLTGARALVLDSPSGLPLTVRLTNSANDYSAGTSVTNSGLVFSYRPLSSAADSISINAGGYVGTEENFEVSSELTNFLGHIKPASVGMVGFDSTPGFGTRFISDPIDLSRFTNALYLGTATWANESAGLTVSGLITPAGGASAPYRFAGYKGGALEVASSLAGSNGVLIGDPNSPGTFGDFANQQYSSVALTGDNSALSGNITLYGGQLLVGQSNGISGTDPTTALGTGTLIVSGMTLPTEWVDDHGKPLMPQLDTSVDGLILNNNISLGTNLGVGLSENYLRLGGQITGTGGLYLDDYAWIAVGNPANDTNSFSGGIYLSGNSGIDVMSDHATGTGPIWFGNTARAELDFYSAAPVVHGLASKQDSDFASLYFEESGAVLTIDQAITSTFTGEFRSAMYPDDSYRIVKTGTGSLTLASGGMYGYHGTPEAALDGTPVSLQVNQGTLVISNNFYIESWNQTFWVHGGTLALDGGGYLNNPIVIDNGGRLAGNGHFASSVNLTAGSIVSPGLSLQNGIGTLHFNELTLGGNGVYEWNLNSATPDVVGTFDQIVIDMPTTLIFASDTTNRFTLKVISLQLNGSPGMVSGFVGTQSYTWNLILTDSISGAFDPNSFTIDSSQFSANLPGTFTLGFDGTALQLTFQPVPEPSTYALLALGLGLVVASTRRRRRA